MSTAAVPVVLSIAGHDPVGGAGIQADIETALALGCHPATVVTCLTVQDTTNVAELAPIDPKFVAKQARAVLADLPVRAIKVGLLGSAAVATAVAEVLAQAGGMPVVVDPVLAAGGGRDLADPALVAALVDALLPRATLVTPNSDEARRLTGRDEPAGCAAALLRTGCGAVLVTGGHEPGEQLVNRLYQPGQPERTFEVHRVPGQFRGTGCTLATAIAALLARGVALDEAVSRAMTFTSTAIGAARPIGRGQWILGRCGKRS